MKAAIAVVALVLAASGRAQDDAFAFDERAPETALEKLIDGALPSVVKVYGASGIATIAPYATGVVVSADGYVLTLDLVMLQEGKTRVVLHDGSVHPAELLPPDPRLGVRMLKIDPGAQPLRPLVPTTRTDWRPGTLVCALGNAFRLAEFSEKVSASFGVLSARVHTDLRYRLADFDYDGELLVTDAAVNPGQEGGALLALDGSWIGLSTRVVQSRETNTELAAAIPAWTLADYIARCRAGRAGEPPPAAAAPAPVYHGIHLFEQGIATSPPAYVERVDAGSPAADAGLRPDDLIVRVADEPVRTCDEFREAIARHGPGDEIELSYRRGPKVTRVTLRLEAR